MTGLSPDRLFSMPAFEGLRLIRDYLERNEDWEIGQVISAIGLVEADARSFDLEASAFLHGLVDTDCSLVSHDFYRACIRAVVRQRPIWAKSMTLGRKRFVSKLDEDDRSIFETAGILADPPSEDTVTWWDEVAGEARLQRDMEKLVQGRDAERLSIEFERSRLSKLGIYEMPKWSGFDDNTVGYDVLSYDKGTYGLVNRLIEVKSTVASPLRFYLSRNEWESARRFEKSFVFHIWDMQKRPPVLYVKAVKDISRHIPSDSNKGKWKLVEVPLSI